MWIQQSDKPRRQINSNNKIFFAFFQVKQQDIATNGSTAVQTEKEKKKSVFFFFISGDKHQNEHKLHNCFRHIFWFVLFSPWMTNVSQKNNNHNKIFCPHFRYKAKKCAFFKKKIIFPHWFLVDNYFTKIPYNDTMRRASHQDGSHFFW